MEGGNGRWEWKQLENVLKIIEVENKRMEQFEKYKAENFKPEENLVDSEDNLEGYALGIEHGWEEALKWASKVLKENYLKEKVGVENGTQYTDTCELDSLSDIRRELNS